VELVATYTLDRIRALGGAKPPAVIDVKGYFTAAELKASALVAWQL
jgi:hypothetical protein